MNVMFFDLENIFIIGTIIQVFQKLRRNFRRCINPIKAKLKSLKKVTNFRNSFQGLFMYEFTSCHQVNAPSLGSLSKCNWAQHTAKNVMSDSHFHTITQALGQQ